MTQDSTDLRQRIFNALPAATFQMDRLLGLLDIVLDPNIPSAAVECSLRPRLLINPTFVEQHCSRDEHLLTLVLHELYHVVLGHTGIFRRATKIQNIAFDAIINAMLARQLAGPECADFLRSLNRSDSFPACLLRPPAGWPESPRFPAGMSAATQDLIGRLYGDSGDQVTYFEVFEQLEAQLSSMLLNFAGLVLLGDHAGGEGDGDGDATAREDPLLRDILRRVVDGWPHPPFSVGGRGCGRASEDFQLSSDARRRHDFARRVQKLLRRAGQHSQRGSRRQRRGHSDTQRSVQTVIPQPSDRRAPALAQLWGRPPLFWRGTLSEISARPNPRETAHIYLDVSGSMMKVLPALVGALEGPHRRGTCRTFGFSCRVEEIPPGHLSGAHLLNDFGTEIGSVLEHLLEIPRSRRPRKVVVFTDGWVGTPDPQQVESLRAGGLRMFVGLVGQGDDSSFHSLARHIERLPSIDI